MAVITVASIDFLPYAVGTNPGEPQLIWRASAASLGDASGGANTIQFNLKAANTSPGNMFSLEWIGGRSTTNSIVGVTLQPAGMETFPPGNQDKEWLFPMTTQDAGDTAVLPIEFSTPRLWIGRAASAGAAGTLSFSKTNDNTETVRLSLMGYMWTPGAMNAAGGPRRPMNGIFPQ